VLTLKASQIRAPIRTISSGVRVRNVPNSLGWHGRNWPLLCVGRPGGTGGASKVIGLMIALAQNGTMGRAFDEITKPMQDFIVQQHMFFVATAPLADVGRVNLSPKGYDSFRLLDNRRVAYVDLTGSGAETIAHLRENGRITFMFCAFDGKPNIVRLYGRGRVVRSDDAEWMGLLALFVGSDVVEGAVRSIVVADIDRTSTSCGYSVPFMDFSDERRRLLEWADGKSADDLDAYWADKNAESIDGLPALG